MAMLTLNGTLINIFDRAQSTDKKTGEIIPPSSCLQIQAENTLPNGQKRVELVTLKVENPDVYKKLLNATVRVPVGAFASGHGIQFYALKGQAVPAGI
jgi:hypothetical protein